MDNRTKQAKIKYEGNLFETNNGGLVKVLVGTVVQILMLYLLILGIYQKLNLVTYVKVL